ncbi:MAG TPA: glycosyltransferase family A protein [Caulobacter sp.]|nr:glycosyltransferase family A protein [Caulobacter sp.]
MADRVTCATRVVVIVPAYGLAHLLGETLASLQAQHFRNWEAVVVDDGAPDDVAAAFAPFADDRRFHLLRTDNGGLATARNRAISASGAPFIALLDGDDLYEPGYLDRMLATIETDAGLGFVSCDAMMFGDRRFAGRRYSDRYPMAGAVTLERVLSRDVAVLVASVIRRSAFEAVGGFDGVLRSAEDLDLWIRLLSAGWRGAILPEVLVRYRRRPGSLSTQAKGMLSASVQVYEKAAASLAGRPEAEIAGRLLARHRQHLGWIEGQEAVLRGDVSLGLRQLAGAEQRSFRWRLALSVMRRAPWSAGFLMRLRG